MSLEFISDTNKAKKHPVESAEEAVRGKLPNEALVEEEKTIIKPDEKVVYTPNDKIVMKIPDGKFA